jgi:hypothetical protein
VNSSHCPFFAGARIYRLKAIDPENDQLTFGIRGQIGNNLLEIRPVSSNEADVHLKQALDREVRTNNYQ